MNLCLIYTHQGFKNLAWTQTRSIDTSN